MSKISRINKDKIKDELLRILYDSYPNFMYTYQVSENIIRDDEFVLNLLKELENDKLIKTFNENKGKKVKRKWGLTKEAYSKYKELLM